MSCGFRNFEMILVYIQSKSMFADKNLTRKHLSCALNHYSISSDTVYYLLVVYTRLFELGIPS